MELKGLKNYIGKTVQYVLERDIDKSGRILTLQLPKRIGLCEAVERNQLLINGDWHYYKDINEIKIIEGEHQ